MPPQEVIFKTPPHFSGTPIEDPKQFIVEFDKAARANRWTTIGRCLDILPSCLSGLAEELFLDIIIISPKVPDTCSSANFPIQL